MRLPTSFDYKNQVLLYLPPDIPHPNSELFPDFAADRVLDLVKISKGHAFVLSTSNKNMYHFYTVLSENGMNVKRQGHAPINELIKWFKKTDNAVLIGTMSLWSGVDIPGKDLQLVILDRIPFKQPSDPVGKERQRRLEKDGGNWFMDLALPEAMLTLKQGFGRLIRRASDWGVVAILDVRMSTVNYGGMIKSVLPPARTVRKLKSVEDFFERMV
jgi:ATP-dependent DNA helicase DinG